MLITLRKRDVYGTTLYDPQGSVAETLQEITGQKTLTPRNITLLTELGHNFEIDTGDISPTGDRITYPFHIS